MEEPINILLVDDEQRNLDALEAILDDPGYRLLRADHADRALRVLLDEQVAAIVLDIKMPGVSGFELAQLIKGTKRFREIPILFLTAYLVDDQDVVAGYGAGAVDYLTKPVNPQILRHKIAVFAELFRKTRALAEANDKLATLNEGLEAAVRARTAELEASEAALRASSKEKDAFLATLAHELRNPLAPLRTGLDLLLQLPAHDAGTTRALGAMNRQLDHMVRLIDDLLDVSRISRGMLELRKERTALAPLIERALEAARPALDKRQQRIVVTGADVAATAVVDPTRVAQILGNLLHNASKYSPTGTEIRVSLRVVGDRAEIAVADDGYGIRIDQLDRVFDMFTRIERATPQVHSGLGIGLAIARRLAEMHGGSLTASSGGEAQGSTFTLVLPGVAVQPASPSAPAEAPQPRASTPGLDIVVVEDNDDAADTLGMWLEELGHRVQIARNGLDGVALIKAARPQLVLCDIGLPGIDGIEVCKQIRASHDGSPVMVALTGWGMDADRRRTAEAGFNHHLVKPVAPDKLRDIIDAVARAAA